MATKFSPKLRISTALISSAIFMAGCATDTTSYTAVKPFYRTQGDLVGVSAQPYYEMGKRYFAQKRYGLALEAFQAELRLNSKSINALNGIAACYDKIKRFDVAESYYYKALRLDPESPRVLSNLGYSFLLQGRDDEAIKVLKLALNKDPGNELTKRHLVLAKSHGWDIENKSQANTSRVAKTDNIPAAESVGVTQVAAQQFTDVDEKATKVASNGKEPAVSKPVGRIHRTDVDITEHTVSDMDSKAVAPLETVADNNSMPVTESYGAESSPVKTEVASTESAGKTVTASAEQVANEPLIAPRGQIADTGLMPTIDVSNEVTAPAGFDVASALPEAAPVQAGAEPVVNESIAANEEIAVNSKPRPNTDISNAVTESVETAANTAQPESVTIEASTESFAVDASAMPVEVVADSGLMPTIDIGSGVGNQTASEPGKDSESSDLPEVTTASVADSGLLPAIDIIIEASEDKQSRLQASSQEMVESPAKQLEIATIDVDSALADAAVVSMDEARPVTVHNAAEYTVEVSNGNGWDGMAHLLGKHLRSNGEHVVRLTNADTFNHTDTVIYYSTGKLTEAEQLASQFPLGVKLEQTNLNRKDIDVRVVLGRDIVDHAQTVRSSLYAWKMNQNINPVSAAVEISNGNGRNGMARLLKSVLASHGDAIRRVTNADNFNHKQTVIYYSKGRREEAEKLAAKLPVQTELMETEENRNDIELRVVLGKDFLGYEVAMHKFVDTNA